MITVEDIEAAGGYRLIYADPAWDYKDKGINGSTAKHYPTMKLPDMMRLPINRIAASDAVLCMWGVYPQTPEAFALIEAWGFKFKTIVFQWVKYNKSGLRHFGNGQWTHGNSEPCWLAVRGKPHWLVRDRSVSQLIESFEAEEILTAQRGQHSAKPPEARERLDQIFGDVPRIELFARETAEGWDAWGNDPKIPQEIDLSI